MTKKASNQPEEKHYHVADSNCRDFHYTQSEIDHVNEQKEERNGHFNEFPLLINNIDMTVPQESPVQHFSETGSGNFLG